MRRGRSVYRLPSTSDNYLTAVTTLAVLLFTTSILTINRPNPRVVLTGKKFLASPPSINHEPIQRTDISIQPLGRALLDVLDIVGFTE
jgi:hypothetical protein